MPELAEVERSRRIWMVGVGGRVETVFLRGEKRIFRGTDPRAIAVGLTGRMLVGGDAHGKQMVFAFSGGAHLGIHLGMTGDLRVAPRDHEPELHDHLVLYQKRRALVLSDPRQFGRVTFSASGPPAAWAARPPGLLDSGFTAERVAAFLARRRRTPVKALLLDQSVFPGIGNWMADEILWRAAIHPRRGGGDLSNVEIRRIWKESRHVAREALRRIADRDQDPPRSWLFPHRWEDGGTCPRTGAGLVRETIGGRTTCFSPARQVEPRAARGKPPGSASIAARRKRTDDRSRKRSPGSARRAEPTRAGRPASSRRRATRTERVRPTRRAGVGPRGRSAARGRDGREASPRD